MEIGEVLEKLLVLDYHHKKTINQLKYNAQLDTWDLNLIARHGSLFFIWPYFP